MSYTFHASREQLKDSGDARASASGISLGASLLLHLGIVGLIFFSQPDTELPEAPLPKVEMVVSITDTNPQLKQPPPASADSDAEEPALEISLEQQLEIIAPTEGATAAELTPGPEETVADGATPAASSAVARASELPADQSVENPGTPGISASEVSNSVTAYIANYKSSLTSDWLAECLRYQNEHGVRTCPPGADGKSENAKSVNESTSQLFRVYVSGAAASSKLLAELDTMRLFLKKNSVTGELARQRYQLAEANYCKLNPCISAATSTSGSFATPISNEGFVEIISFGTGGSANILSDLASLIGKPKPTAVRPFVPYRFTAIPEGQAESEDEFKVEAPIFPIRR